MSSTAAQSALGLRFAPDLYRQLAADGSWDDLVTQAASELNTTGLATGKRDPAIVRLALHYGQMQNPNIAGGGAETGASNGGSSRSSSHTLPTGYAPDWYQTGHGRALIGLFHSSAATAPIW